MAATEIKGRRVSTNQGMHVVQTRLITTNALAATERPKLGSALSGYSGPSSLNPFCQSVQDDDTTFPGRTVFHCVYTAPITQAEFASTI
jgi:hypothetical protein